MGHAASKSELGALQRRLDKNPIGAPAGRHLTAILEELFTSEECRLAAAMPMRFASAEKIAKIAGLEEKRAREVLAGMTRKGLVTDITRSSGRTVYLLNPTVIGFFEFSMMRVRDDIDQKALSRKIWRYIKEDPENAFLRMIQAGPTYLARPLVHEDVLEPDVSTEILDYERAGQIIDGASDFAEGICHCRHVKLHMGERCDLPLEHCLSLGISARYLTSNGLAKPIDRSRALEILDVSRELGMVQMCDNVKDKPMFICNCCKCCCEMLLGFRTLPDYTKVISSNYVARIEPQKCNGCGICVAKCPIDAIELDVKTSSDGKKQKTARVDSERCIGCGVCHRFCKKGAIALEPLPQRVYTPESAFERVLVQALEHGTLGHLLFQDPTRLTHRTWALVLNSVLKLPPAAQLLAKDQLKSKFVNLLIDRLGSKRKKAAGSKL